MIIRIVDSRKCEIASTENTLTSHNFNFTIALFAQ